jgi:lipopolysaccharide biosynthesis regulator YciM
MKTLRALTLTLIAAAWLGSATAQGLRPEVGKPLQQASELLKAGKHKEALAKVREAEAVPNRTPAEQLTIDRMKAAAAQRAGDTATAIQALESIYGKVSGSEQGQIAEQLASAYAQQRNNAKATEWVNKAVAAGNTGPGIKQMQSYLQSTSGDYGAIAKDAAAEVAAAEQAGRKPDEGSLLRLPTPSSG